MANPFPGMDPYLEGGLWMSVHSDLAGEIARQLSPQVRPKYLALSSRRVVMARPDPTQTGPSQFPDVGVVRQREQASAQRGGTVIRDAPVYVRTRVPEPIPHVSVEIRDAKRRQLVTAIEVLSPTNKRGDGRPEYARKRQTLLRGSAHLMEIDLIRVGRRFPTDDELPAATYYVFLSRAGERDRLGVWPIALSDPLPRVTVPLLAPDPDVELDLQKALTTVYDTIGNDDAIDHTEPPPGPMLAKDARWVDRALRKCGRR